MSEITDPSPEFDNEQGAQEATGTACRPGPPFLVTVRQTVALPEPAYDLWVSGGLAEALGIPDDCGARIEIIGGEIVLSKAPVALMAWDEDD